MIICTVSIIFCLVSTFLLYQTKEKVSTAYKHPYTVSNTAREIHSRALSDSFLNEIASLPVHSVISIDVVPIPKELTTKVLQKKYLGIEK